MIATVERPDVRIAVRVPPELLAMVQKIADEQYEGRLSMAAREAFRQFVTDETSQVDDDELAAAS